MNQGYVIIGGLFPAFIGTDWESVPAYDWRKYDILTFNIYERDITFSTSVLEDYHLLVEGSHLGGGSFKFGEKYQDVVHVDVKPQTLDWGDKKVLCSNHLSAKVAYSAAPRPITLIVKGHNPRPIVPPIDELDKVRHRKTSKKTFKPADTSPANTFRLGQTDVTLELAQSWGFDDLAHLKRYVDGQEQKMRDSGYISEPFLPYTVENYHKWLHDIKGTFTCEDNERNHCYAKGRGREWDEAYVALSNVERGFVKPGPGKSAEPSRTRIK